MKPRPTTCEICGGPLPPSSGRGRPRLYCPGSCDRVAELVPLVIDVVAERPRALLWLVERLETASVDKRQLDVPRFRGACMRLGNTGSKLEPGSSKRYTPAPLPYTVVYYRAGKQVHEVGRKDRTAAELLGLEGLREGAEVSIYHRGRVLREWNRRMR